MRNFLLSLVLLLGFGIATPVSHAVTIWTEDFSNVSDWSVISSGNGTITTTSIGNLGNFHEPDGADYFIGRFSDSTNYAAFNPANKSLYDWIFTTDSLTSSVSYSIYLDQYDPSKNYIDSVWTVQPDTNFVGTKTINLGGFSFNASTAYLAPRVKISTGNPDQSVYFDDMHMDVVPEPASFLLLGGGLMGLYAVSRKRK